MSLCFTSPGAAIQCQIFRKNAVFEGFSPEAMKMFF
jgi:hypothetical protein